MRKSFARILNASVRSTRINAIVTVAENAIERVARSTGRLRKPSRTSAWRRRSTKIS